MSRKAISLFLAGFVTLLASEAWASPPSFDDMAQVAIRPPHDEEPLHWPEPVRATIVFRRFPDSQNLFEAEVYCQARYDLADLSLEVAFPDDVQLRGEVPSYRGRMAAGESKQWIVEGQFEGVADIPPALLLDVRYGFPFEAVATEVHSLRTGANHSPTELHEFLSRLAGQRGTTVQVMKSLPLYRGAESAGPLR